MSLAIIDLDTGELVAELGDGDKVIRKASIDSYNALKSKASIDKIDDKKWKTEEWKIESFYKGNVKELRTVIKTLDVYERALLLSIAPYVSYEHCCLEFDNGNDITFEHLMDLSGMGRTKMVEVLGKLIRKDILYKGKNSKNNQYFVNPWLFCKGQRINVVLKNMFKNYRIRVMGGLKWKEI